MRRITRAVLITGLFVLLALASAACSDDDDAGTTEDTSEQEGLPTMGLELTSAAFNAGEAIPARYTCTGDDTSPPLAISGTPDGTESFALIMDDPDAPGKTWVHWVVYNLPGDTTAIPPAISSAADLPGTAAQGKNSWGRNAYGGPCPPSGTHRYFFKLYALDTMLDLDAGATKDTLLSAMTDHILAETHLMGTYKK